MTTYSDSVQILFFKCGPILNHSHLDFTGTFNICLQRAKGDKAESERPQYILIKPIRLKAMIESIGVI